MGVFQQSQALGDLQGQLEGCPNRSEALKCLPIIALHSNEPESVGEETQTAWRSMHGLVIFGQQRLGGAPL